MSLRSPLGRVVGLGSAGSGYSHWFTQRVTAVAVAVLGLWLLVAIACLGALDYGTVTSWLARPTNAVLCGLFVFAAAQHTWLGLEVVIEDYVGNRLARLLMLVAAKFLFIIAAAVGVLAILRVATGAGG
jgi:succinate dehydrogenase / fumarate reductase membrane anchor subunit